MSTTDQKTETTEFAKDVNESTPLWQQVYESKNLPSSDRMRREWPTAGDKNNTDEEYAKKVCRVAADEVRKVLGDNFINRHRAVAVNLASNAVAGGNPKTLIDNALEIREKIFKSDYNPALELPRPVAVGYEQPEGDYNK